MVDAGNHLRRALIRQWLVLLSVLGGGAAVIGTNLYQEYRLVHATEQERLLAQTRVMEQNLARQLDATHRTLRRLLAELPTSQRFDKASHLAARLVALEEAMPGVRTLVVVDAAGVIRLSNRPKLLGVDVSAREYFIAARRHRDPARLMLTHPYRTVLGVFAMNLVQVIPGPDGEFRGLIAATLEPDYFATLMNSVRYAPDMWSAIAHGDGPLFLMAPERRELVGVSLAKPGSFFTRHINAGLVETVFDGTVYTTGERRMMAQRTVRPENVPLDNVLVVAASRELNAIFASWRTHLEVQVGVFLFLTLAAVLGLASWQRVSGRHALERQAARRDLEASHQRFERMAGAVPCLLYDYAIDADGRDRFLYLSARCEELLEIPAADLLADIDRFWSLVHPGDIDRMQAERDSANREGRFFFSEIRLVLPSGRVKWVQVSSRPSPSNSETFAVWSGFIIDVTERKTAELAVTQREHQLRTLVASMSDLVMVVDTSGRITEFHWPSDWTGPRPDPDAYLGRDYASVLPEPMAQAFAHAITGIMAGESSSSVDVVFAFEGRERRLHAAFSALDDGVGWPRGFLCIARDLTERLLFEDELRRLASTDFLTGVVNRRAFVERLTQELDRVRRFTEPACLLMLDIDHFKDVNDRLGHAAGDEVLRHLATTAVDSLRRIDLFGRLGGEEFGVLLPGTDIDGACDFAERLRCRIEASPATTTRGPVGLTVSLGVATLDAADPDADAVLARADAALYRAKVAGRNRVERSA